MIDGIDIDPPCYIHVKMINTLIERRGRSIEFRRVPAGADPKLEKGVFKFSLTASCELDAKTAMAYLAVLKLRDK